MPTSTGSCFCGKVKISYTGEPVVKALCHCLHCRKISGSAFSVNLMVPTDGFKVTGSPKAITTSETDSGNSITSYFCPDCGSTLYRDGESNPALKVVKVGVLDDYEALNTAKPAAELFVKHRVEWVPEMEGAGQVEGMASN